MYAVKCFLKKIQSYCVSAAVYCVSSRVVLRTVQYILLLHTLYPMYYYAYRSFSLYTHSRVYYYYFKKITVYSICDTQQQSKTHIAVMRVYIFYYMIYSGFSSTTVRCLTLLCALLCVTCDLFRILLHNMMISSYK